MEVVAFPAVGATAWNQALAASDDSWFWHTRAYSEFLIELGAERGALDLSFAIMDRSEIIAACPLYFDIIDDVRRFGCGGDLVPFPAIRRDLRGRQRQQVLQFYMTELARLASEHSAAYLRIKVSALSATHLSNALPPFNPLIACGFLDLPMATQVIDLTRTREALWTEVRKGHKYDVRRAEKACTVAVADHRTITPETFYRYQALHRKDAGRATRSQRSFDLMLAWIQNGLAALVEARLGEQSIGFALLLMFGSGAYYGSGCKDPDVEVNASHLLQWKSIEWLAAQGYRHYDVGLQQFGSQWASVPSEKDLGIARFKRGFGGVTIPVHAGEFFYSREVRARLMQERFEHLASAETVAAPA